MVGCCLSPSDQIEVLRKLAEEVIRIRKIQETVNDLVANPYRLYTYVIKTSVNWRKIATEINQNRNRIYHWYRETHLRNILNIKMTEEDRQIIRGIIMDGIESRRIAKEDIYGKVREEFGKKYPRQELRMTYNNIINSRSVKALLKKYGIQHSSRRNRSFAAIHHLSGTEQRSSNEDVVKLPVLRLPGYNDETPSAPQDEDETVTFAPESSLSAPPESAACSVDEPKSLLPNLPLVPPLAPAPSVAPNVYTIANPYPTPGAVPYFQAPGVLNLQPTPYPFGVRVPLAYVPVLIQSPGHASGWPVSTGDGLLGKPTRQP
ncbi:Hypothetical protein GLP15_4271 [Giardia lamblia P15]|uniref:Uncharacterized protein n=1 Tax=Giardia intestinalis (strain P15) TaxID=658858 RepID=E1EY21_GIAIA|nr:Hypothetical protein GLP15_4271 [Giardia lamblia P15]